MDTVPALEMESIKYIQCLFQIKIENSTKYATIS
jgi:hypothetical protein